MAVRNSVLPKVVERPNLLLEPSHATICLDPLKRFFDFRGAIDTVPATAGITADPRYFSEHCITIRGDTLTFLCFNTAIMSTIREQPGQLLFPVSIIPTQRADDSAVISVVHHPSNWLEPNCGRSFRAGIEAVSDIVLTGHEHVLDTRRVSSNHGDASYVAGGALQESGDADVSEFNVLIIDTSSKKKRHIILRWDGENYLPVGMASPDQMYFWEDFSQNNFRIRKKYKLRPEFANWLDDPEVCLTHRAKGQLTLSNVYVYPSLKRLRQPGETSFHFR